MLYEAFVLFRLGVEVGVGFFIVMYGLCMQTLLYVCKLHLIVTQYKLKEIVKKFSILFWRVPFFSSLSLGWFSYVGRRAGRNRWKEGMWKGK